MNLILFVRDIHDKLIKHRYVHVYMLIMHCMT